MNVLLYSLVVLIWGTTWLAISAQAVLAPALTSVFYRFLAASLTLTAYTALTGRLRWIGRKGLFFTVLQGMTLFSFNFICFYNGARFISGGMEALIFSFAPFFNGIGARVFYGEKISRRFLYSFTIGLCGLLLILSREIFGSLDGESWKGILLALGGTCLFSLGNMVSLKQGRLGNSPLLCNCYGMTAGALMMGLILLASGAGFDAPLTPGYLIPLAYLAVPGSVIAFTVYLTLVYRIGASKAAYATLLTPIIALILAFTMEGEEPTPAKILGILLILSSTLYLHLGKTVRKPAPAAGCSTDQEAR